MPQPNSRFANYVPVAERVNAAAHEVQLLQSDPPVMLNDVLGYIRVTITMADGRTANGTAQFRLDATTGAQKTNPLEDAETSAVGRALGFLGYSSDRSIATREDMQRTDVRTPEPSTPQPAPRREITPAEAKTLFWDAFAGPLGAEDWQLVTRLVGREMEEPQTVERWRHVYKTVNDALKAEIAKAEAN